MIVASFGLHVPAWPTEATALWVQVTFRLALNMIIYEASAKDLIAVARLVCNGVPVSGGRMFFWVEVLMRMLELLICGLVPRECDHVDAVKVIPAPSAELLFRDAECLAKPSYIVVLPCNKHDPLTGKRRLDGICRFRMSLVEVCVVNAEAMLGCHRLQCLTSALLLMLILSILACKEGLNLFVFDSIKDVDEIVCPHVPVLGQSSSILNRVPLTMPDYVNLC